MARSISVVGGGLLIVGLAWGAYRLGASEQEPSPIVGATAAPGVPRENPGEIERGPLSAPEHEREHAEPVLALAEEAGRATRTALEPAQPVPEPAPAFVVGVLVKRFEGRKKKPAPGVRVEAGFGFGLDPAEPAVASGTTGGDGTMRFELDRALTDEARAAGLELWVRVAQPGYGSQPQSLAWPEPAEEEAPPAAGQTATDAPAAPDVRALLIARTGVSVRGRLHGADGEPCGGRVRLKNVRSNGGLGYGTGAYVAEHGWFVLTQRPAGAFQLYAEGVTGTAVVDVEITDDEPEVIELFLRGPGVVRGSVRDGATGVPAAALELLVMHADADDEAGSFIVPEPTPHELARRGAGHFHVTLQTGPEGDFEAIGLLEGDYNVRARTTRGTRGYPHLLTSGSVVADGRPLELLFGRPHILVRVVDEHGAPFTGELGSARGHAGPPGEEWPETAAVACTLRPQDLDGVVEFDPFDAFAGSYLASGSPAPGQFVFEVDEQRTYLVGAYGGAVSFEPREVFVPVGAGRVEVVVPVATKPLGSLSITAEDGAGNAVTRNLATRIESAASGLPLVLKDSFYRERWPQVFELPAGPYRIVVEGVPRIGFQHGTLLRERTVGRYEAHVDVRPGETREVVATLPEGARLKLELRGEVRDEDRAPWRARLGEGEEDTVDFWATRAEVVLVPELGWPIPVDFRWELEGSSAAGTHLTSRLPLGTEDTSELLPSGRFRLQARLPGGRLATTDVVLREGETTLASLVFP